MQNPSNSQQKAVTAVSWESRILWSWWLHWFSEISKVITALKKTEVEYKSAFIIKKKSPCYKVMLQLRKYSGYSLKLTFLVEKEKISK